MAWYHDDQGNVSSLRIIVVPSAVLGQLVVIAGVWAMFMNNPSSVAAMGVGAGMIATSQAAKAWQKKAEKDK